MISQRFFCIGTGVLFMLGLATAAFAAETPAAPARPPAGGFSGLDKRIQDLKSDVMQLNRDLLVLEEELLFPANTQIAVFLSMDKETLFELDSVQVKIDDKVVTSYLYTPTELQALKRGGVQPLYLGNLRSGEHEIIVLYTGKGPHDRDYRRGATTKFEKGNDPKYIELQVKGSSQQLQPEFQVKVWQ